MQGRFRHIIYITLLAVLSFSQDVKAQQEPIYSIDVFSIQNINPAYTGVWERVSASVLARKQWLGFDGAPSTQSLLFEYPLNNKKTSLGLALENDKIGLEKTFSLFGSYSHKLDISKDVHVRLGLNLGFTSYSNNLDEYTIYDPNNSSDPAFQGELQQFFIPNFGVGAFLYADNFFAGMALPKILQNELNNKGNGYVSYAEMRHLFFNVGYIFPMSNDIKFKPTLNSAIVVGAPIEVGVSANFLFKDQVWVGALYRIKGSLGLSGQYMVNKNLTVGYAVDFSTSDLSRYNYGTHEVIITYEIRKERRSPKIRYY